MRSSLFTAISTMAWCVFGPPAMAADPPPNDEIGAADVIDALPFVSEVDASGATVGTDPADPEIGIPAGPSVWFRFTPTADVPVLVSAADSDNGPAVILFTEDADVLIPTYGDLVPFEAELTGGTTYWIEVFTISFDETPPPPLGKVRLSISDLTPPNDDVDDAVAIELQPFGAEPYRSELDTRYATIADDDPLDLPTYPDASSVWYTITSDRVHTVAFDTTQSNHQAFIVLLTGTRGAFEPVVDGAEYGPDGNSIVATLAPGVTYTLLVVDFVGGGDLALTVEDLTPPNDDVDGAITIALQPFGSEPFLSELDTRYATVADDDPLDLPTIPDASSLWYTITTDRVRTVEFDTAASSYQALIVLLTGTRGAFEPVLEDAGAVYGPDGNHIVATLAPGVTYTLLVGDVVGGGDLVLTVEDLTPPNDDVDDAEPVDVPFRKELDTRGASGAPDDPFDLGADPTASTVWYTFTPATDITIRVGTGESSYEAFAVPLEGARGSFAPVTDAVADGNGFIAPLLGGVTYTFMVLDFVGGGDLVLTGTEVAALASNDDLADAIALAPLPYEAVVDTSRATVEAHDPLGSSWSGTVWYTISPAEDMRLEIDLAGSDYETVIAIFTEVAFEAYPFAFGEASVITDLPGGVTYYIMIAAPGSGGTLHIAAREILPPAPPDNDDFAAAEVVDSLPYEDLVDLTGATVASDDPLRQQMLATAWYRFTPARHMWLDVTVIGQVDNAAFALFRGERGDLEMVASGAFQTVPVPLEAGVTYHIMVLVPTIWTPGPVQVSFAAHPTADNDDFDDALEVPQLTLWEERELVAATHAPDDPIFPRDPEHQPISGTVWYRFTPERAMRLYMGGLGYGVSFGVFTGERGALTAVAWGGDVLTPTDALEVSAGTTYWFMVGAMYEGNPFATFTFVLAEVPSNDQIGDAEAIAGLPFATTVNSIFATTDVEVEPCYQWNYNYDIFAYQRDWAWWSYTAESGTCLTASAPGGRVDFYRDGEPAAPQLCGVQAETLTTFVAAGQTVIIGVGQTNMIDVQLTVTSAAGGADGDGDGVPDACDVCRTVANPGQENGDADPLGDACDNCLDNPLPLTGDRDGDGFGDQCDNCFEVPNADQQDGDGDAVGDACDNCVATMNTSQVDIDADFAGDVCDNCLGLHNSDQLDADGDLQGDACDWCEDLAGERVGGWTRTGDLVESRQKHAVTLIESGPLAGEVLVAGGSSGEGNLDLDGYRALASAELYDPDTGEWRATFPLASPRNGFSLTTLTTGPDAGKVMVLGNGFVSGRSFPIPVVTNRDGPELYDPLTGVSAPMSPPPFELLIEHFAVRLADGRVMVHGLSIHPNNPSWFYRGYFYDPTTRAWTYDATLDGVLRAPASGRAVLLEDGRVLLMSHILAEPVIYDPATHSATLGAPVPTDRSGGALALLGDGRVLAAGGSSTGGSVLAYDVAAATWSTLAPLPEMLRTSAAAQALEDGRVLFIGGFTRGERPSGQSTTPRTDLFDPFGDQDGDGLGDADDTCPCGDEDEPVIESASAWPTHLWPPNQRLRPVTLTVEASDACDDTVSCEITGVKVLDDCPYGASECAPYRYDVRMVEPLGPLTVLLRSVNRSRRFQRVYAITVECRDLAGNASETTVEVPVVRSAY